VADRSPKIRRIASERLTAWLSRQAPMQPALRIEPQFWLVFGACDVPPEDGFAEDVSDAYATFAVEGEGTADVLAQGIALDLESFVVGAGCRTRLGDVAVILMRTPDGFVLRCERSYGEWLGAWLARARGFTTSAGGT
jgi:heterotetrameric sarcosine oxidase gamma subunit